MSLKYKSLIALFTASIVVITLFCISFIKTDEQPLNNDSILVSEYQMGLDSFMRVNPKAAQQFMDIIENINTK